jgi:3-methyladenine DNA glycosylase Tag
VAGPLPRECAEGAGELIAFEKIRARAVERLGEAELKRRLPKPKSAKELEAVPDDRYLSAMSRRIFQAGLKHSLVDGKWPAFEEVFFGFDLRRVGAMSDEATEGLMKDERLIRHWGKLKSVQANAVAMREVSPFGKFLAGWPGDNVVGLWDELAKRFDQMGGNSGPMFLRMIGKDTFVISESVAKAVVEWDVLDHPPKGKKDRLAVQDAFNAWAAETKQPLSVLSMTLAGSVD